MCYVIEREVSDNPIFEDVRVTLSFSCGMTVSGFGHNRLAANLHAIRMHPHALTNPPPATAPDAVIDSAVDTGR